MHSDRRLAAVLGLGIFLSAALLTAACRTGSNNALTLAGSTSVEPFAERLAELYMHEHREAKVSVQGGGSSAGVRAVTNGICQIGMSSRSLVGAETTLTQIPIAYDAIVIIVNASSPVRNLTLIQARDIFAGRLRNWKQLGGPDRRITVVTREEGSGTRASFEEKVMTAGIVRPSKDKPQPLSFAADALVQDSNGAVREIVASDPAAVGYISFGLVDDRVHALTLDGVMPDAQTVRKGRYPVGRRFLFLTSGPQSAATRAFLDYTLGPDGQKALADEGLIPVK